MTLLKILALGTSSLLGLALAAAMPPEPASPPDEPPPPKAKKKEDRGPGGELKKTYDLLRRVRSDNRATGRPEERLRDWTERATKLYRDRLKSLEDGEGREAREYGLAAHDLARAVDHARNAATFDLDNDLPPPPEAGGPEDEDERTRRDLRRAYDRIGEMKEVRGVPDLAFYLDASKDLYNAARRDADRRPSRAGRRARPGRRGPDPRPRAPRPGHRATIGPSPRRSATGPSRPRPRQGEARRRAARAQGEEGEEGEARAARPRGRPPAADRVIRVRNRRGPPAASGRGTRLPHRGSNRTMDLRNRIGLYGSYFLGMAGIGFTLPYLPLYLGQEGLSDRAIGVISTLAALAGLAQFPVGLWSDRLGWRKPFLVVALAAVAASTWLLRGSHGLVWVGFLVILFAENGIGRAVVESLAGAEAAALAPEGPGRLGPGRPPVLEADRDRPDDPLRELAGRGRGGRQVDPPAAGVVQTLAVVAALLIHEPARKPDQASRANGPRPEEPRGGRLPRDAGLWAFAAAMVLYHAANAPGGVYLGLYLKRDLHAPERMLAYAFAVSMVAWMIVVWPAGWLADRWGRKPLLVLGWTIMAVRLALVAILPSPGLIVANQALDGLGNGLFAVLAASWVTDRLADPRRSGEAQVIVGSCLVLGSAIGPAVAGFVVGPLGYRGLFWGLAGVGAVATAIVVAFVPETLEDARRAGRGRDGRPDARDLRPLDERLSAADNRRLPPGPIRGDHRP